MTNEDKELERLAKAATPGLWRAINDHNFNFVAADPYKGHPYQGVTAIIEIMSDDDYPTKAADIAFIAAANPQTVLALLERLQGLESMHERDAELIADRMRAVANCQAKLAERKGTVRLTLEELRDIKGALAHVYDPGFLTPELMDHAKLRDKVASMIETKIKETTE